MTRACPPAAATSSARLAPSWPATRSRAGPEGLAGAGQGSSGRGRGPAPEEGSHLLQVAKGQGRQPGQGRLGAVGLRHHHRLDVPLEGFGRGQDPAHGPQGPVQPQLAQEAVAPGPLGRADAHGHQDAGGHGEVEEGALFAEAGGRQVDGHPPQGHLEAAVPQGGPHPVPALQDRGSRQTDHVEGREARPEIHFHLDRLALHAGQGRAPQTGKHAQDPLAPAGKRAWVPLPFAAVQPLPAGVRPGRPGKPPELGDPPGARGPSPPAPAGPSPAHSLAGPHGGPGGRSAPPGGRPPPAG